MIKKIFLIGLGLVLAQCSNDLEELNVNEKAFTDVPAETLMSNGQRELAEPAQRLIEVGKASQRCEDLLMRLAAGPGIEVQMEDL